MSRYAGLPRHDVEWTLSDDGEILVRGKSPNVLCSGYQTADGLVSLIGGDGWFHTGDIGRRDEHGNLIFIERRAESIRVKGEYVPIPYVERAFADIGGLKEIALWRRASDLVDHEAVLYVVADGPLPIDAIAARAKTLPAFMQPKAVVRIAAMPRLNGVGKISRRRLDEMEVLQQSDLGEVVGESTTKTPRADPKNP
jgi:acyl-coenzyme A synthetase/AMP-(fatty) acid ligase